MMRLHFLREANAGYTGCIFKRDKGNKLSSNTSNTSGHPRSLWKKKKKTPLRLWAQQQQLLHPSWINYRHLNHSLCLLKLSWRGNASCADSTNYTLLEVFKRRFVLTVIIKEATQEKELTLQKQRTAQGNLHVRLFHKTDFNPSV